MKSKGRGKGKSGGFHVGILDGSAEGASFLEEIFDDSEADESACITSEKAKDSA